MNDIIRASQHLICETWPQRGGSDTIPHAAWERGQPLELTDSRIPNHDEARYDPVTRTVLFRRNATLTTCYSVDEEDVTNVHGEAVREAVESRYGTVSDNCSTVTRFIES